MSACSPVGLRYSKKCHWYSFKAQCTDDTICCHDHRLNFPLAEELNGDDDGAAEKLEALISGHLMADLRRHGISDKHVIVMEIFCVGPILGLPVGMVECVTLPEAAKTYLQRARVYYNFHRHFDRIKSHWLTWILVCYARFYYIDLFLE